MSDERQTEIDAAQISAYLALVRALDAAGVLDSAAVSLLLHQAGNARALDMPIASRLLGTMADALDSGDSTNPAKTAGWLRAAGG